MTHTPRPPTTRQGVQCTPARQTKGRNANRTGREAEHQAEAALHAEGWTIRARRLRTPAGEIDLIAEREGLLVIIEVKSRPTLAAAATALQPRQQRRLIEAAEIALANNPEWGRAGVRFDLLLVDPQGQVRRIADAFRAET